MGGGGLDGLAGWVDAGGPVAVLLVAISAASLALIAAKALQLIPALGGAAARGAAIEAWARGDAAAARAAAEAGRRPADRLLARAMAGLAEGRPPDRLAEALERDGAQALAALGRHLRLLDVIALTAPLLGLLGTVLGMIATFQSLEEAGGAANAAVLAGGIWQALLTTALGLIAAIPAGVAGALFAGRVDRIGAEMEDALARIFAADDARRAG